MAAVNNETIMSASTQPSTIKRFYQSTDQEVENIRDGRHEENTKKNTSWGLKVFRDWLNERDVDIEFEFLTPQELNKLLGKFYVDARTQDGSLYSKSSLNCIRAALQRHLQSAPYSKPYSIINNPLFATSNETLIGLFKKMTAEGSVKTRPHYPIEAGDIEKLFDTGVLGMTNPKSLVNLVWFLLCLHFGKRGDEGFRVMKKDTFYVGKDDQDRRFIGFTAAEKQKNHQGNLIYFIL